MAPWARPNSPDAQHKLDLEARATLAFFEVNLHVQNKVIFIERNDAIRLQIDRMLAIERAAKECGATASVVLLHPLDSPTMPFFAAEKLALTVAHVG